MGSVVCVQTGPSWLSSVTTVNSKLLSTKSQSKEGPEAPTNSPLIEGAQSWCVSVSQPPAEVCLTDLAWDHPGV